MALAGDVTFDLGDIGANGGPVCTTGCVLSTNGQNTFSTMGLTIGAIGYNAAGAVTYVTQKPWVFEGPGETGIGESDVYNGPPPGNPPSDPDWEITTRRTSCSTIPCSLTAPRASASRSSRCGVAKARTFIPIRVH